MIAAGNANLSDYIRHSTLARDGTITEGDSGFGFQSVFPLRHPLVNGWFAGKPQVNGRTCWLWQDEPGPYGDPHELPALAADRLDEPDGSFDIRRIGARSDAQKFLGLLERSYESVPEGMADMIVMPVDALLEDPIATWGLYSEDELVAGVLTFTQENVTGFYWAATLPEHRGRGYAAAVVQRAVAAADVDAVVCQASREGLPVWERMGMKRTHTFVRYLLNG